MVFLVVMAVLNEVQRALMYVFVAASRGEMSGLEDITLPTLRHTIERQMKMLFAFMSMFWTTLWTAKISLMLFYRRLFTTSVKGYMFWWKVVFVVVIVTYLACFLSNFLVCPLRHRLSMDIGTSPFYFPLSCFFIFLT